MRVKQVAMGWNISNGADTRSLRDVIARIWHRVRTVFRLPVLFSGLDVKKVKCNEWIFLPQIKACQKLTATVFSSENGSGYFFQKLTILQFFFSLSEDTESAPILFILARFDSRSKRKNCQNTLSLKFTILTAKRSQYGTVIYGTNTVLRITLLKSNSRKLIFSHNFTAQR